MRPMHGQDLPIVFHQAARLKRRARLPDGNSPFAGLPAAEWMQVLMVFLMVPADPAVRQLPAFLKVAAAGVNVYRVVELLQDAVVPPDLPQDNLCRAVLREELSQAVRVIGMALADGAFAAHSAGLRTIAHMDAHLRHRLPDPAQQLKAHGVHICRRGHIGYLRLFPVKQASRLMVLRGMAMLAARRQVAKTVSAVLLPKADVVRVKDRVVLDPTPAERTGVVVTGEHCRPQRGDPVTLPMLVILALRQRPARIDRLHERQVELTHLEYGAGYGHDPARLSKEPKLRLGLMLQRRGQPYAAVLLRLVHLAGAVIKPRRPVAFPVPPCPAVFPLVVVFLLFISKKVPLLTDELMLLRADRDTHVQVPCVALVLDVLHIAVTAVKYHDREERPVPVDPGAPRL